MDNRTSKRLRVLLHSIRSVLETVREDRPFIVPSSQHAHFKRLEEWHDLWRIKSVLDACMRKRKWHGKDYADFLFPCIERSFVKSDTFLGIGDLISYIRYILEHKAGGAYLYKEDLISFLDRLHTCVKIGLRQDNKKQSKKE